MYGINEAGPSLRSERGPVFFSLHSTSRVLQVATSDVTASTFLPIPAIVQISILNRILYYIFTTVVFIEHHLTI